VSNLKGHYRITAEAARRAALEFGGPAPYEYNSLSELAVLRDLFDVVSLGHWMNHGQKHHFMREFGTQSPFAAYTEAVNWIKSQATEAANALASLLRGSGGESRDESVIRHRDNLRPVYAMQKAAKYHWSRWQCIGNAIHALEDSFARGHVIRDGEGTADHPGDIIGIRRYMGSEKDYHEEMDDLWAGEGGKGFSLLGEQAIRAVTALLRMVVTSASQGVSGPVNLIGWSTFQNQFLRASPDLPKEADRALDLILKHCTAIIIGGRNFKTLNFDEEGLTADLLKIVGKDMAFAREVFEWLDESFNSDADDVAELYVRSIRSGTSGVTGDDLKRDTALIMRLIKCLDEGVTFPGEQRCIDYLRSLQKPEQLSEFAVQRAEDYVLRVKNWKKGSFAAARKPNAFLTPGSSPKPTSQSQVPTAQGAVATTPVAVVRLQASGSSGEILWLYLELKSFSVVHEDARGP
jgi:hypothetical protein